MIMVDILVPDYDETYDLEVDETVKIGVLLDELTNVICQKEMASLHGSPDDFCLCSMQLGEMLSPERILQDYGITNGCRLLMV